jgi:hypothetical protein
MPITKVTSNVLAPDAALNNLNAGSSVALSVPLTVTSTASINGNFTVDTNTLFVNAANDRVGIGTTSPTEKLTVSGNVDIHGDLIADSTIYNDSTSYFKPSVDVRNWYLTNKRVLTTSIGGDAVPTSLFFSTDGTKLFCGGTTNDTIRQYTLSTPWDIDTISSQPDFSLSTLPESDPHNIYFTDDGLNMFLIGLNQDQIRKFILSAAWDLSTASLDSTSPRVDTASDILETNPRGIWFSDDGLFCYIVGTTRDAVFQLALPAPWDITSFEVFNEFSVAAQEANPFSVIFNKTGTKMFVTGTTGDDINEYRLDVPWDTTTAQFFSTSFTLTVEGSPTALFYNEEIQKAWVVGSSSDQIREMGADANVKYYGNSFVMDSQIYVGGRAEFAEQVYFNTTLTTIGSFAGAGLSITGNGTIAGNTSIGTATTSSLISVGVGATVATATKTINIGIAGRFNSNTNITVGSMDSGGFFGNLQKSFFAKDVLFEASLAIKNLADPFDIEESATGDIVVFDAFTELSDTLLQNHTPDTGSGWSRIQVNSAVASFTIESSTNRLKPTANVNDAGVIYIEDTSLNHADYEVSMDLLVQDTSDDNIWLIARYQDSDNFYGVKWTTSTANCSLHKKVNGVFTQLGLTPNIAPQTGASDLTLRVVGNKITVVNGGVIKLGFVDSDISAAGKAGIAGGNIGQLATDDFDATWRLDNFKVQYYEYKNSTIENGNLKLNNGGVILKSPNGTDYKITVNNDGSLQTTEI